MSFTITYPTNIYKDSLIKLDITKPAGDYIYYTVHRSVTESGNTTAFEQIGTNGNLQWSEVINIYWDSVNYRITWIGENSSVTEETGYITTKTPSAVAFQLISYSKSLKVGVPITLQWNDVGYYPYEVRLSINGGDFFNPQQIARDAPRSYSDSSVTNMPNLETIQYQIKRLSYYSATITTPVISLSLFPKMSVKVGTEVSDAIDGWVRVDGTLRKITDIWVMANGALKKS